MPFFALDNRINISYNGIVSIIAGMKFMRLLLSMAFCVSLVGTACAWCPPILVTPDSACSRHSRCTFDADGNLHFFFANNRYQETGAIEQYDIFHCRYRIDGTRLTEDVRLDTTQSFFWVYPSPIYGSDDKLHVAWADNLHFLWNEYNGIY